jgi:hypothetical protein
MEDKRGTKHSHSPSKEGSSSSSSGASTPLSSLSDSVPPPVSPSEGSPHRPPSPVHEHDGPSETIPVVDLSSDEEEILPDTMGVRSLPGDSSANSTVKFLDRPMMATSSSSVTLLKKRMCARRSPPMLKLLHLLLGTPRPHPSPLPTPMMHLMDCKMIIVMVETRLVVLRLSRQESTYRKRMLRIIRWAMAFPCLHHIIFGKRRMVVAMQNHCSLNLFVLYVAFLFLLCPCSVLQPPL